MVPSSPACPSSFDPAVFLHSELGDAQLEDTHSDDLEALHLQNDASRAKNNEEGVVIQHRAWKVPDIFRSEGDYAVDTPSKQRSRVTLRNPSHQTVPPSSPPLSTMPLISSPVAYPASSSPALISPRRKRKFEEDINALRSPLAKVNANLPRKVLRGFVMDEDDEDDAENDAFDSLLRKRKRTHDAAQPDQSERHESRTISPEANSSISNQNAVSAYRPNFGKSSLFKPSQMHCTTNSEKQPPTAVAASGKTMYLFEKLPQAKVSYEELIASRSTTTEGMARTSYYGINVHQLMDEIVKEDAERAAAAQDRNPEPAHQSIEQPHNGSRASKNGKTLMWTEKYRAKKFTDLIGDERTHRSVLRWLKGWDPIVFPGSSRPKAKARDGIDNNNEVYRHRKILLLTGPPGLGKTTLAHVCAKQAGYEVQEINASDERSRDVVQSRIRDMVGTENVKGIETKTANGKVRKAGKPVCVVVDEVDGVVSGSGGGGEGGFIKALIDLINLDQKNSSSTIPQSASNTTNRKKKGGRFRMLRPLILICNDVYHPSLRPLRQSSIAEVIHIRKPPLNMVSNRMKFVFEKEGILCDNDAIRRLCEATWGVSSRKEGGTGSGAGEGDIRGVMVVGEWVAGRLRARNRDSPARLTRRWLEEHVLGDLGQGGGAARSLGRGGAKEIVDRIFLENAGFPKTAVKMSLDGPVGPVDPLKHRSIDLLREMINTCGDYDRIATDCFTSYPGQRYQDDTFLSKPNHANDWLHFHDLLSTAVHSSQEWELAPYLCQAPLAFHHLFASPATSSFIGAQTANLKDIDLDVPDHDAPIPFSGPSAPYAAAEAQKKNRAALTGLQSGLSLQLSRTYRSLEGLATELLPYTLRMLAPDVKPTIINTSSARSGPTSNAPSGGSTSTASVRRASEKALVARAVTAMAATGVRFEKARVDFENAPAARTSGGWIYRMDPPLDSLAAFDTMEGRKKGDAMVRFAVRQVLDGEFAREMRRTEEAGRRRRGGLEDEEVEEAKRKEDEERKKGEKKGIPDLERVMPLAKKDFFGRIITTESAPSYAAKAAGRPKATEEQEKRVWVSFNEGYSNAVRKPITLDELMRGL